MRIALDIRYRTSSGTSNYIMNVLPRLFAGNKTHEFVLLKFAHQEPDVQEMAPPILCPPCSAVRQVLWDQITLPGLLRERGIDMYHGGKYLGPWFSPCMRVTMAHSADYVSGTVYWTTLGNPLYRRSTRLIAVSDYLATFFAEEVGVPASRIVTIYNGKDPRFRSLENPTRPATLDAHVTAPFILGVGNFSPLKSHLTTAQAFCELAADFPDHSLVFAGSTTHAYCARVRAVVAEAGLAARVHFLGFVDADTLLYLYNRATMKCMPSITEGCPIAMLEAMACGCPVIGSGRGGIPEVGADAIDIVEDPHDVPGWRAAMSRMLSDPAHRATRSAAGQARAAAFTWERTAEDTLTFYDSLAGAAPSDVPEQADLPHTTGA